MERAGVRGDDGSDAALMRHIRLLSDSCDVWRPGYSLRLGLLLQCWYWFEVIEVLSRDESKHCGCEIAYHFLRTTAADSGVRIIDLPALGGGAVYIPAPPSLCMG